MVWFKGVGWGIFWFFSVLGATLAFRFVPGGFSNGFLPGLEKGIWQAVYDGVYVGIKDDFRHIFYHVQERLAPLLVHMLIGVFALVFVPFQLWRSFRTKHRGLHRWMGRIAVVAIVLSGWGSMVLAINMDIPAWGRAGFVTGALLWIMTAMWATLAIWQKNVARHQSWMVVVAAITFGAVMIRIEFPIWRQFFEFEIAYSLAAWSSWVLNLVAVGLWRLGHKQKARVRAQA